MTIELPLKTWSRDADDVLSALRVRASDGLATAQVLARRRQYGPNRLKETPRRGYAAILAAQFSNVVVLLLLGAGLLAVAFGDLVEGAAILAVLLINATLGFVTELKATRSIEALRRLGQVYTTVRRDGRLARIAAHELVPGDIVLLEAGDIVTADLRLIEAGKLQADESMLTGESLPVAKQDAAVAEDAHLADRDSVAFKGTSITRGAATGVVVGTGLHTELGRISSLVARADTSATPLEKRLDRLGRRLAWFTVFIAIGIALVGLATGRDLRLALEVAIALAVAAIPEGLPIVATIALSRGMWRMAKRNALIARLSAVETLGATSVILTDKTGTLTENRMTVTRVEVSGCSVEVAGAGLDLEGEFRTHDAPLDDAQRSLVGEVLEVVALCNNAALTRDGADGEVSVVGDPTEVALLVAAVKSGIDLAALAADAPELHEDPFDSDSKLMATFHPLGDGVMVAVKGAPEAVLSRCTTLQDAGGVRPLDDDLRGAWCARCDALAAEGLRLLAAAKGTQKDIAADPYNDLTLVGIVALMDPPREGVREAVSACHNAGIDVLMVTGDHVATARSIAIELGLLDEGAGEAACVDASGFGKIAQLSPEKRERLLSGRVIARATPEQKLDLIDMHQQSGHVVAMTGDGVNDAPALKKADIGVAMGRRGTEVAREAAAMILEDDEFSTIVGAIAQGRAIFANIRKFVVYLLSCNLSEVFVVGLATLAGAPLPLLPLQILFLNLVTDVFPALALGVGEGSDALMRERPRPSTERILTRRHWYELIGHGLVMSATVLAAMALAHFALHVSRADAVTVSFLTLAIAQLWHVFNMRAANSHWLRNEITGNVWIWVALGVCALLLALALYLPGLAAVLQLTLPTAAMWSLVLGMSLVPLILGPLVRLLAWRR